jgi:hypothetical protein
MLYILQLRFVELLNLLIAPSEYWGSVPTRTRFLCLHHNVQVVSDTTLLHIRWVPELFFWV